MDFFGNYKRLMIIPIILLIPLFFLILVFPGLSSGIDLTGGNSIILRSDNVMAESDVREVLAEFNLVDLKVSTTTPIAGQGKYGAVIQYGKDPLIAQVENVLSSARGNIDNEILSIEYSNNALVLLGKEAQEFENSKVALSAAEVALAEYKEDFSQELQNALISRLQLGENAEFQKREVSPTLGSASLISAGVISIIGAILIIIVIFISFRQVIPSVAIIQAMGFDVLAGLAGMAILNIPLSLTTIPALLLLVGYSVDTDIMLTTRMLKGKHESPKERAMTSMKTGLTMTGTTLAALVAMVIVAYFYQIEIIYQIAAILLFGLLGDVVATWFMNAPILLWFVERVRK